MSKIIIERLPPTEDPKATAEKDRVAARKEKFERFFGNGYQHLFDCLGVRAKKLAKGQAIFREGDRATHFGIVFSGSVNVVRYCEDGREKMLMHLHAGEAFGTTFAFSSEHHYFANVEAAEPSEVLIFSGEKVLAPCARNCPAHAHLLAQLLKTLARRNSRLARKIDCLTQRRTEDKLLAYLRMESEFACEPTFRIPFTRQQLADYLNVDRAALSSVIGQLVRRRKIRTVGKAFTIPAPR